MGTPLSSREAQVAEVLERLYEEYPEPEISLDFSNRLELVIAVILSAQCTDERVNRVTAELFETYDGPAEYAAADVDDLAADIDSITYFNQKAGYITSACRDIVEAHDGKVPDTMAELTDLAGVGRKTANVILQHGHEIREGIVVDTHVQRISRRLGLTEYERPDAIEADLVDLVPRSEWTEFTHLLIAHGRETCTALNPDCGECVLEDRCPSSKLDSDVDLADGTEW
ncbi:endonuclease III [Halobacteriales archaeon QH_7_69_31]|nr:MAG: endonuclease III [Halobacteriales archaeon QH_7_69_31]